jgi:arsenite oxidase small subunit
MKSGIDRRSFFRAGGTLAAGAAGLVVDSDAASAANGARTERERNPGATVLPYPRKVIARAKQLLPGAPVRFTFPDEASPCVVLKNGRSVPTGVGPERDIAAFSTMCPHMGCPTAYDAKERVFRCPCHFSMFDAELGGQMVCGQATVDLPEIVLEYDAASDSVIAVSVRGLLYGRSSNIL